MSKTEEEIYQEELAANGVEIEGVVSEEKKEGEVEEKEGETPTEPEPKPADESQKAEPEGDEPKEEGKPAKKPAPARKRTIYDDYKEVKTEKKDAIARAEQAEADRDALKIKLEALETAKTPEEKQEAKDDLESFAQEIGADPQAIRKLQSLLLKNLPGIDADTLASIEEFKEWKKVNGNAIEAQKFSEEFEASKPALKKLFPTLEGASDDDIKSVKSKLDELSHKKEWHDKDLEYIAFKHQDTISALISPKRRGIEKKGRADGSSETFDFNPDADYASMTLKEREAWDKAYNEATSSEGLITGANGKKILI